MMLPTFTMGPVIEMLHWWGHQRHRGDVYQPRFDALSSYWSVVPLPTWCGTTAVGGHARRAAFGRVDRVPEAASSPPAAAPAP
jgi:hypothetical protein